MDSGNRACNATADKMAHPTAAAGAHELPCTVAAIHHILTGPLKQKQNAVAPLASTE